MNRQTLPSPREHHFYVAIAKYLFQHSEYGIVSVRDPVRIKDAEQCGLSPIILYGLTVAGLPIRWMTFTPLDQPRSFRDVLSEAWRNAEGLRGRPDILRVNRHLALASPVLARDMARMGILVEVADAEEKSLPASLRTAQDSSRWLLRMGEGRSRFTPGSIQSLCRDAQYDHDFHVRVIHGSVNSRKAKERIQQWLALPTQGPVPSLTCGLDWEPGPWLSSWECSLPPSPPRHFSFDRRDARMWLPTGEMPPGDIAEDDHWADTYYDNAAEIVTKLVACWPNPAVEIAKSAAITLRELRWFASGKAPLDPYARFDLEKLLGIEYDESSSSYVPVGPYVLRADKPKALGEMYEDISQGGNACPCEIVPLQGSADPSWRYVVINTYGQAPSIVMSPRGERITEQLPELFLNYAGITPVSTEFYRDVVSTCARASREPAANTREMRDFAKRYEKYWTDCIWQPE